MKTNNNSQNNIGLDSLISGLRSEDSRNEKMTRRFQWLYWALLPIYVFFLIFNPGGEHSALDRVGFGCYAVAFAAFAIFFRIYSKEYKNVDYSIPTIEMLKKAAYRYKLFHKRLLFILIPVLLVGVGTGITSSNFNTSENAFNDFLISQAMYLGAISIGFCIGVIIWYNRSKPLRDHALDLIKEIES